jgi:hypothetical protein
MKQYEYNVLTNRYHIKEEVLNLLGKEGWELVSHTYTDKSQSIEDEHVYTFKREKTSNPKGIADTQRYDGVKAKTFVRDESGLDGNGGPEWKDMFWENAILYARLEHMIMEWSNDETKTAGELTRSILKLIK